MRVALVALTTLVGLTTHAAAQRAPATAPSPPGGTDGAAADRSVRVLPAPPVHRLGEGANSPVVSHPGGGLVVAAGGVLRTGADGATLWHHAHPSVVDVAATADGAVFALARLPVARPTGVRLIALSATGAWRWSVPLHRGQVDRRTMSDLAGTADGDALVCSTVRAGRSAGVVIDRIGPTGAVRWSRRVAAVGECQGIAADQAGNVTWVGHVPDATGQHTVVEQLDPAGLRRWRQRYDGHPVIEELVVDADGAITLAGVFDGQADLLPGPAEHLASATHYTTFVGRFGPDGTPRWARVLEPSANVVALLRRGADTLVVEAGRMTRLDAGGEVAQARAFGVQVMDGVAGGPYIGVTGAALDRRGQVTLVGQLPDVLSTGSSYHLFGDVPYAGARGPFLARPGW